MNDKLWIFLTPTVHALLSHSNELIEGNEGFGLLEFSETGLEANNKFMRFYRQFLARKTSQMDNLTDVFTRMWLKSDPFIKKAGPIQKQIKKLTTSADCCMYPQTKEDFYMTLLVKSTETD